VPPPLSLLDADPVPAPAAPPADALRAMLRDGDLDVPLPGHGDTTGRWSAFARWGRADLVLARLAEGHADAVAILRECDARPAPGAVYGVWAARPGGHGAQLARCGDRWRLDGTVRFCSGAHLLDRALVVADAQDGTRIIDAALTGPAFRPCPAVWAAPGMAASDTADVVFDSQVVADGAVIGGPGRYLDRPGFWWGGAGVAAVWLGGAAGILDDLLVAAPSGEHRLAHVGALHAHVQAVDALLARTAAAIDRNPAHDHRTEVATARAAVEQACRVVLDRAPVAAGVAALTGSATLARRLADLQVYVRQHHGEADLAELGSAVAEHR
jgi:alkylation response protein AidB-like acyl-CoA dehydrogenase